MSSPELNAALMPIEKRWWRTEEQRNAYIEKLIEVYNADKAPAKADPVKAEKAEPKKKSKKKESVSVKSSE